MASYSHQDDVSRNIASFDMRHAAILVIDELGPIEGTPLELVLMPPTLNTSRIIETARANNIPVIFANDAHFEGIDRELDLWGPHNVAGTPEAQPSVELNQQPSDFVIEKPKYSAFFQTRLRSLLDDLGAHTLILTGFDTNICVRHTAADAYFNNYDIVVVDDATATFLIGSQDDGLEYMEKCYAATIVSTNEVVAALEGKLDGK